MSGATSDAIHGASPMQVPSPIQPGGANPIRLDGASPIRLDGASPTPSLYATTRQRA
jgi:hypothetical protein